MFDRIDTFAADTPVPVVALAAAAAILVRMLLARRRSSPRSTKGRILDLAARAVCSGTIIAALLLLAARIVLFTSGLPLSAVGAGAGVVLELLVEVYRVERGIVPGRFRVVLPALRVLLFILGLLTFLQPVYRIEKHHSIRRTAAVLVDCSASMTVADDRLPLSERLQLAHLFLPGFPEPPADLRLALEQCEVARQTAARLRMQKSSEAAGAALKRLESRVRNLLGKIETGRKHAARIPGAPTDTLDTTIWFLKKQVLPAVEGARNQKQPGAAFLEKLAASLGRVQSVLTECSGRLDSAWLRTLPAEQRRALDALTSLPRIEIARQLVTGNGSNGPGRVRGLADVLHRSGHRVRLFRFAGRCAAVDRDTLAATRADAVPAVLDTERTDLAAALDAAARAIPPEHLAGVILLTDARHNTRNPVDAALQQLTAAHVPVSIVLFGDPHAAPTDAAVVDVQAPDTVYAGDAPALDVEVAAGGLRETPLRLEVLENDKVILQRTLHPDSDAWRRRILLPLPPPSPGTHDYLVRIQRPPNDAVPANNERTRRIRVRSDAVGLLIVDARPRWEFRYLKNLFTGRDRSVRAQVVLLHPDRIPGVTVGRPVRASLSRAPRYTEADALPAGENEWRKFDVIILGDLSPDDLGSDTSHILERCVAKRGATLIVLAGPVSMPHRFSGTPFADLLPVTIRRPDPAAAAAAWLPAPEPSWRLCAAPDGLTTGLLLLADTPEENGKALADLPAFHWRHPLLQARPAARVLAWALPPEHPPFLRADGHPTPATPDTIRKTQDFIRNHAVMLWQRYGLGRVLLLTFDRTWRLRYHRGDVLHHRFWGQILRWAAPQCLPDGDDQVRAGSDRAVYQAGEPVRLRAAVRRTSLEPVTDAEVRAELLREKEPAGTYVLRYVPDSPGVYEAVIPDLPPGRYTARVYVGPGRKTDSGVPERRVETRFSVTAGVSGERVFLAPDRGMAERIAGLTGGRVLPPWRIDDAVTVLRPAEAEQREVRDIVVWNSWPWLLAVVAVACVEWYLRKRRHLP